MPQLTILPAGKTVMARSHQSLIQAARSARVMIPQRCGGHASCQMCKVIVQEGELTPPTVLERRKLPESDLASGVRLACQARVGKGDCTVRLAENKLKSVVSALLAKAKQEEEE